MTIVQEIENLQLVFYILEDVKEKRLSVSKLSKESGIDAQKAYKWGGRNSEISLNNKDTWMKERAYEYVSVIYNIKEYSRQLIRKYAEYLNKKSETDF